MRNKNQYFKDSIGIPDCHQHVIHLEVICSGKGDILNSWVLLSRSSKFLFGETVVIELRTDTIGYSLSSRRLSSRKRLSLKRKDHFILDSLTCVTLVRSYFFMCASCYSQLRWQLQLTSSAPIQWGHYPSRVYQKQICVGGEELPMEGTEERGLEIVNRQAVPVEWKSD